MIKNNEIGVNCQNILDNLLKDDFINALREQKDNFYRKQS